jgi:hypothetical protein
MQSQRRGPSGHRLLFRMQGTLLVIQSILGGLDLILRSLLLHSLPLNHFPPGIFSWFILQIHRYGEVVGNPFWESIMQEEYKSLLENQTWDLVPLPSGRKLVRCRWVYRTKSAVDGQISIYKSRLVAKSFQQVHGNDYDETFTPIAKMDSIHLALAIAVAKGWEVHHMDVNNAFIHGDLSKEIYMRSPKDLWRIHIWSVD